MKSKSKFLISSKNSFIGSSNNASLSHYKKYNNKCHCTFYFVCIIKIYPNYVNFRISVFFASSASIIGISLIFAL